MQIHARDLRIFDVMLLHPRMIWGWARATSIWKWDFFFRSLWVMAGSILGYWKAYYARAWVHLIFSIFGGFKVKQQTWWLLNLLFFHFILSKVSSEGILINFYFFGLYNKIKPTLPCLLRVFFIPFLLQDIYLFFTNNI